jgi:hypothetical protein
MNIGVVTTLNKKLYKQYGYRFFETYNWPFDLIVYSEDMLDIPNQSLIVRSTFDEIPSCEEFVNRNKQREVPDTPEGFLQDAVRFSYKVYAYTDQIINNEDYDGIICIDADSVFYKPIDVEWIKQHIHRDDSMMTYLGRGNHYSECGFLYFNMKHNSTKAYAREMKRMYDSDEIYQLSEVHDSYIWDHVRKAFESNSVKNHNIGDGKVGHVQARSILGPIYDHIKGPKRKKLMRSPEARV